MSPRDSALDPLAMARARRLLATPVRRVRNWPPVAAAALAAAGAVLLAGAVIFIPPAKPDASSAGAERT